jgi:hypothetical protein
LARITATRSAMAAAFVAMAGIRSIRRLLQ